MTTTYENLVSRYPFATTTAGDYGVYLFTSQDAAEASALTGERDKNRGCAGGRGGRARQNLCARGQRLGARSGRIALSRY